MAQKPVVVEGDLQLFRSRHKDRHSVSPKTAADYFLYWLHSKKKNEMLLTISCRIPGAGNHPNLYTIGTVQSKVTNGLLEFPKMLQMIRTDLRKTNKRADLSGWNPTPRMERYYRERLGARRRDGHLRFPQKITLKRK